MSFEGVFGCGKTTQLARIEAELRKRGEKILVIEEGASFDKYIPEEDYLYNDYYRFMDDCITLKRRITKCLTVDPKRFYFSVPLPLVEIFLVLARHAINYEKVFLPLSNDSDLILLADRGVDTFYAHQLITLSKAWPNVDKKLILERMREVVSTWLEEPNLTILFRIPAKEAINRLHAKGKTISDPLDLEILEESVKNYDFLAEYFKERFCVIDGRKDKDSITNILLEKITAYLDQIPRRSENELTGKAKNLFSSSFSRRGT